MATGYMHMLDAVVWNGMSDREVCCAEVDGRHGPNGPRCLQRGWGFKRSRNSHCAWQAVPGGMAALLLADSGVHRTLIAGRRRPRQALSGRGGRVGDRLINCLSSKVQARKVSDESYAT